MMHLRNLVVGMFLVSGTAFAREPAALEATEISSESPDSAHSPARSALIDALKQLQPKRSRSDVEPDLDSPRSLQIDIFALENLYPLEAGEQALDEAAERGLRRRITLGGVGVGAGIAYYTFTSSVAGTSPAHLQITGLLTIGSGIGALMLPIRPEGPGYFMADDE